MKGKGWAYYHDNSWEFGKLDTSAQLKEALRKIEESGDSEHMGTSHYRNAAQRSYLAQKAYTRYLFSKINQFGGYDYIQNNNANGGRTAKGDGKVLPSDYDTKPRSTAGTRCTVS